MNRQPTALVVEDEPMVFESVRDWLEGDGIRCVRVADGPSALEAIRARPPDIVILDVMLPGMDGFEVCRRLRADSLTTRLPILMLTARVDEVDRVAGLDVGADDYVAKPFSGRELVARVKALLRRADAGGAPWPPRLGELELDEARQEIRRGGAVVPLTATERRLLGTLLGAGGRVVGRAQLFERTWGYARPSDVRSRTLDVHVSRLREKLGAEGRRLVTVKGEGYRVELDPPSAS